MNHFFYLILKKLGEVVVPIRLGLYENVCPIFFRDHSQHPQLHNLALERLDVIKHGTQVHTSLFLTNPGFTFYFLAFSKSLSSPYNSICFQIMICVFLTQI